jgi:hypothetical protein
MNSRLRGYSLRNYFRSSYYYPLFSTCFGLTTIFKWAYIHWKLTLPTTDPLFFGGGGELGNLVDNGDWFLVTVDAVAVVELANVCCGCTWRSLILALLMFFLFFLYPGFRSFRG